MEGAVGPFTAELIGGGRSNLTFTVTGADGRRLVVRRPPLGHVLATAHDMAREHRIISAVGATSVPVPPALGLCTDEAVNGAPFYVMGFVDGVVLDAAGRRRRLLDEERRATRQRRPHRRPRRPPRRRRRRDRARRPGPAGRLRRAAAQAVVDAVGQLEDPRAAGHRRGRHRAGADACRRSRASPSPTATTASATASPIPSAAASPPSSTGSCARWATRSPTSATSASTGPTPGRRRAATTIRRARRGFPAYADLLERYAAADRSRPVGDRLLRRVRVVAPGRHQRGRVRPVPPRGDGRPGHRSGRAGDVQGRHRGPRRVGAGGGATVALRGVPR